MRYMFQPVERSGPILYHAQKTRPTAKNRCKNTTPNLVPQLIKKKKILGSKEASEASAPQRWTMDNARPLAPHPEDLLHPDIIVPLLDSPDTLFISPDHRHDFLAFLVRHHKVLGQTYQAANGTPSDPTSTAPYTHTHPTQPQLDASLAHSRQLRLEAIARSCATVPDINAPLTHAITSHHRLRTALATAERRRADLEPTYLSAKARMLLQREEWRGAKALAKKPGNEGDVELRKHVRAVKWGWGEAKRRWKEVEVEMREVRGEVIALGEKVEEEKRRVEVLSNAFFRELGG
ncbi:hypothetical protein HDU96_002771 [Phlyctochytrium bullatum]|nr:hypothetical protein HDU96_002771 [Phlyctochytrium bullatum]